MPNYEGWETGALPSAQLVGHSDRFRKHIQSQLGSETTVVSSVLEFIERVPQKDYEKKLSKIEKILKELGFKNKETRKRLSEFVFADILMGRPVVDPSAL